MQAVWFNQSGDASDVLVYGEREMPPQPAAGEVLVRLYASGVNPSDVKKRAGLQPAGFVDEFVIPHSDGAGVIEAVGNGVARDRVGERVFVYQAQYQRHWGTCAQYVTVPQSLAAPLPENAGFDVGACAGIPMMTAHRCVFADGDVAGKHVLVTGASGRVGFYAVQWALQAGANVIATAGSEDRCEQARSSGLQNIINYRQDGLVDAIMDASNGEGIDRIIDVEFGVNIQTSVSVLKTGGVIASYSSSKSMTPEIPFYPLMFNNISLQLVLVYNMSEEAKIAATKAVYAALSRDALVHRIAQRFPLEQTSDAHLAIEAGGLDGCVVVEIP